MTIENAKIKETNNNTYVVIGDTKRFGIQEILYESWKFEDCVNYLADNGINYTDTFKEDREIQIGNRMVKRCYVDESGRVFGHTRDYGGWHDITEIYEHLTFISPYVAKVSAEYVPSWFRSAWSKSFTVKFRTAKSW